MKECLESRYLRSVDCLSWRFGLPKSMICYYEEVEIVRVILFAIGNLQVRMDIELFDWWWFIILAYKLKGSIHSPPFIVFLTTLVSQIDRLQVLLGNFILYAIALVILQLILLLYRHIQHIFQSFTFGRQFAIIVHAVQNLPGILILLYLFELRETFMRCVAS